MCCSVFILLRCTFIILLRCTIFIVLCRDGTLVPPAWKCGPAPRRKWLVSLFSAPKKVDVTHARRCEARPSLLRDCSPGHPRRASPSQGQPPIGSSQCFQTRGKRVRHERKPSERFPGACLRITSGLPTSRELIGLVNRSAFSGTNPRNAAQP